MERIEELGIENQAIAGLQGEDTNNEVKQILNYKTLQEIEKEIIEESILSYQGDFESFGLNNGHFQTFQNYTSENSESSQRIIGYILENGFFYVEEFTKDLNKRKRGRDSVKGGFYGSSRNILNSLFNADFTNLGNEKEKLIKDFLNLKNNVSNYLNNIFDKILEVSFFIDEEIIEKIKEYKTFKNEEKLLEVLTYLFNNDSINILISKEEIKEIIKIFIFINTIFENGKTIINSDEKTQEINSIKETLKNFGNSPDLLHSFGAELNYHNISSLFIVALESISIFQKLPNKERIHLSFLGKKIGKRVDEKNYNCFKESTFYNIFNGLENIGKRLIIKCIFRYNNLFFKEKFDEDLANFTLKIINLLKSKNIQEDGIENILSDYFSNISNSRKNLKSQDFEKILSAIDRGLNYKGFEKENKIPEAALDVVIEETRVYSGVVLEKSTLKDLFGEEIGALIEKKAFEEEIINKIKRIVPSLNNDEKDTFALYILEAENDDNLNKILEIIIIIKAGIKKLEIPIENIIYCHKDIDLNLLREKISILNGKVYLYTEVIIQYLETGDGNIIPRITPENQEKINSTHELDIYLENILKENNGEKIKKLKDSIQNLIKNLQEKFWPKKVSSTINGDFGIGSGSFTDDVIKLILGKIKILDDEGDREYLERIKNINLEEIIKGKFQDLVNNHNLSKVSLLKNYNRNFGLFDFLKNFSEYIIGELEDSELNQLAEYYTSTIKEEIDKLKRSLGI